jgi:3-hydroxybutyryl-CoA dehydrogenase
MNKAIEKVCVVGAGTMGHGIAQASAQAGYQTAMVDVKQELVERGMNLIGIGLGKFVDKGKLRRVDADEILARIRPSTEIREAAREADYVIESVFERADVKSLVFQQLEEICRKRTILASNTSGIPISLLASATRRPDRVIGMHFMYPVPIMGVVEVVKSLLTSEETLDISLDFAKSLDKQPIVVKDSPGFVSNRIIPLILNEAANILEENLATLEDVDKMCKLALGWPIGPFGLLDVIGIDTLVDLMEGIYQQTGWQRYKPAPLLKRMVEIGYLGRKAGKGFYELFGSE